MAANIDERHLFTDEPIETFWDESIDVPVPKFRDAMEQPATPTGETSYQYSITVPAANATLGDCLIRLRLNPNEAAINGVAVVINTQADGGGTAFTAVTSAGALGDYEFRVYDGQPWVDFAAARAGDTVWITVIGGESREDADHMRRLYGELSAQGAALRGIIAASGEGSGATLHKAAQDLLKHTLVYSYMSGDNLMMDKADMSDRDKWPSGILLAAASTATQALVAQTGWLTDLGTGTGDIRDHTGAPAHQYIYASQDTIGAWTYYGDVEASYPLTDGQVKFIIGEFLGSGRARINVIGPVFVESA